MFSHPCPLKWNSSVSGHGIHSGHCSSQLLKESNSTCKRFNTRLANVDNMIHNITKDCINWQGALKLKLDFSWISRVLLNTSSVSSATSSFIHLEIHLTSVNQVAVLQRRMMFTAQVNMRQLEAFQGTTCRLQDGTGALQVRYNVQGCSRLFDPRFCG